MTNVINVAAAGVRATAARYDAGAVRTAKATPLPGTAPGADPARALVDVTISQVTYTASLETLRTANKMMMGYLLNIKV
jgi:hypothetical protein